MADLSERGQMIVVSGIAVAVGIVVLVVLLNSVIYTQNVATRGGQVEEGGALEYRVALTDGAADLLDAENDRPYVDRGRLAANASEGIRNVSRAFREQWQTSLAAATTGSIDLHNGTRVVQANASRDLTNASGGSTWEVATGADGVREFRLRPTSVESVLLPLGATPSVTHVEVEGAGGNTWRLYVYNDSTDTDTHLSVENGSGSRTDQACGGIPINATIDLTAGTVGGVDCAALSFAEGTTGPWDVSIVEGSRATGAYQFVANTTAVGDLEPPGASGSPRWEPVVYSAALNVTYRTPDLVYVSEVRVTPGEDDV